MNLWSFTDTCRLGPRQAAPSATWGPDTPTWQYKEKSAPRAVTRDRGLGTLAIPARRKWHPYPLAADMINRMEEPS